MKVLIMIIVITEHLFVTSFVSEFVDCLLTEFTVVHLIRALCMGQAQEWQRSVLACSVSIYRVSDYIEIQKMCYFDLTRMPLLFSELLPLWTAESAKAAFCITE